MVTCRELLGIDSDSLDVGFMAGDFIEKGLEGRERLCDVCVYKCELGRHKTKLLQAFLYNYNNIPLLSQELYRKSR